MESEQTTVATRQNVCELVRGKRLKQLESFGGGKALTKLLDSDPKTGLPEDFDFEKRRKEFGKNFVPLPRERWYVELLWAGLNDTTILMLLAASIVSLILGLGVEKDFSHGWIEGVSILVSLLVVINVQAATDYSKAREFRRQQMQLENQQVTQVIRGGKSLRISPRELVVGDIIRFAVGDIIPVDCVLIDGSDIKIDESALTGETKLVKKAPFIASPQELNSGVEKSPTKFGTSEKKGLLEKIDPFMVSGTNVMSGSGSALVVAVGEDSVQGAILAAVGKTITKSKKSDAKKLEKVKEADAVNANMALEDGDKAKLSSDIESQPQSTKKEKALQANHVEHDNTELDDGYESFNDGGTLVEKLDNFALLIGKVGGSIALLTLAAMLLKYAVVEFAQDAECKGFSTELSCNSTLEDICLWKSGDSLCIRQWDTGSDLEELLSFLITAITILVVVVPEGLPLAVTLSLAVSMKRMTEDNNQVKHMDACETMGSATTVCSDKTGTLTINKMTVVRCAVGSTLTDFAQLPGSTTSLGESILSKVLEVDNAEYAASKIDPQSVWAIVSVIAYNGILNSAATSVVKFKRQDDETPFSQREYVYQGNATECALLKLATELGFNVDNIRKNDLFLDAQGLGNDWGTFIIPFSSERKRMSIVIPLKDNKKYKYRVFSKGASTYILDACDYIAATDLETTSSSTVDTNVDTAFNPEINLVHQLTSEMRNNVLSRIGEFQREALRVIGLAYKDLEDQPPEGWRSLDEDSQNDNMKPSDIEMGMTFLGIVGIEDPLRPEIVDAIKQCATAGVDVRMCTGDALETAVSIAVKSGILKPEHTLKETLPEGGSVTVAKPDFAMIGAEFVERVLQLDVTKPKIFRQVYDFNRQEVVERLEYPFKVNADGVLIINQTKMDSIWPKLRVLARCQPQDKLILVRGLRNSKVYENLSYREQLKRDYNIDIFNDRQVVAVTGDGTNDAPALKEADVGFAMGITGTEIAKQASDILLLDDNFQSIVKAIMWGRNVYQAISKFVQFQLTVNVSAVTLAVLGSLLFGSSPLQPVQMLWVNLIMDSLASLALATDPPHKHLLLRSPYGRRRKILTEVMIFNILGQSCYQLAVLFPLLFAPQLIPGNVADNREFEGTIDFEDQFGSVHWTVFFNAFVMMQLFNEFNSRKIQDVTRLRTTWTEWNVFSQISENKIFLVISVTTFVLQVLIVQFGGVFFTLSRGGLNFEQWVFCLLLGFFCLVWQQIVVNPLICLFGHPENTFQIPIAKEIVHDGSKDVGLLAEMGTAKESQISSIITPDQSKQKNGLLKKLRGGFKNSKASKLEADEDNNLRQEKLPTRDQSNLANTYTVANIEL